MWVRKRLVVCPNQKSKASQRLRICIHAPYHKQIHSYRGLRSYTMRALALLCTVCGHTTCTQGRGSPLAPLHLPPHLGLGLGLVEVSSMVVGSSSRTPFKNPMAPWVEAPLRRSPSPELPQSLGGHGWHQSHGLPSKYILTPHTHTLPLSPSPSPPPSLPRSLSLSLSLPL